MKIPATLQRNAQSSAAARRYALLFVCLVCVSTQAAEVTIRIHADEPGPTISRYIYGHFMEHLGRGVYGGV